MYRRVLAKVSPRRAVYCIVFLIFILALGSCVWYWKSTSMITSAEAAGLFDTKSFGMEFITAQRLRLAIDLFVLLIIGVLLDIIVHVSKRDGFKEGRKNVKCEHCSHSSSSKIN